MQAKSKPISTKIIPKNQLFKNPVIIDPDDLKEKLSNAAGAQSEIVESNNHYNQMLNVLFDENKFKIRNDFDRRHSKEFLKEKDLCLQSINLDESLLENDDENEEVLNRVSSKFTFGQI